MTKLEEFFEAYEAISCAISDFVQIKFDLGDDFMIEGACAGEREDTIRAVIIRVDENFNILEKYCTDLSAIEVEKYLEHGVVENHESKDVLVPFQSPFEDYSRDTILSSTVIH